MDKLQNIIDFELSLRRLMMSCIERMGQFFDYEVAVEDETDMTLYQLPIMYLDVVPKSSM